MKALTDEESDAMQMTFPSYVHGMLKMESFAGVDPARSGQGPGRPPRSRRSGRPEQSRLEVRYSPTLAGALVDALPYLVDYPYGCTEQTLNRFLPTVITQKILHQPGLDLKAIRDKRTNLNAQELGDARGAGQGVEGLRAQPGLRPGRGRRGWSAAGMQRLADMQLSDGGWGWFSGYGEYSSPHTTALVVHGLQLARQNDLALPPDMLERGVAWLTGYQAKQAAVAPQLRSAKSSRTRRTPTTSTPLCSWSWSTPACVTTPCSASSTAIARICPSMPRRSSAWRWSGLAKRTSWRWCSRTSASMSCRMTRTRPPISSSPTRATGGGGTAARSRPTRFT